MGAFLRTLVALAIGAAAGAVAIALQPQWAAEIARVAAPVVAQLYPPGKTSSPPLVHADAVLIKDSSDGDFEHFLGPYLSIHTAAAGAREYFGSGIGVTIVVDLNGNVIEATPKGDREQFHGEAVRIARQWKFIPFERNGRPVAAKIDNMLIEVHPPERRQDYRQPFPEIKDWKTLRINLSRTECFGECASYAVELTGEGQVTYEGKNFVALRGRHRGTVDQRTVKALLDRYRRADFFTLLDGYRAQITDNPTYAVSISFDGRSKTVVDYVGLADGMPDAVHDLENAIDRAAGTDKWLYGNADTVPALRAEGWKFQSASEENQSIAAGIAEYGSPNAMKDLIAAGAPLTAQRQGGYWSVPGTALEIAANRGKTEIVAALLTAQVAWPKPVLSNALQLAARRGIPDIVLHLIGRGADCALKNQAGHTVLMSAAESGVAAVVSAVLICETSGKRSTPKNTDVNAQDGDGATALMLNSSSFATDEATAGYDRGKVVEMLIAAGARVDLKDKKGDTALTSNNIYPDVAAALLKAGANVNAQNAAGETALMKALTAKLIKVLLAAGADPTLLNARGQTAVEVLRENGYSTDGLAFLEGWITAHPNHSEASAAPVPR